MKQSPVLFSILLSHSSIVNRQGMVLQDAAVEALNSLEGRRALEIFTLPLTGTISDV